MGKLFCAVMENLTLFLQLLLTSCCLFLILVVSETDVLMSKNTHPISVLVGKENPVGENIHWF